MKIKVVKGLINKKTKISNTVFTLLKPVETRNGTATAIVDASELFGKDFKYATIELSDYLIL